MKSTEPEDNLCKQDTVEIKFQLKISTILICVMIVAGSLESAY